MYVNEKWKFGTISERLGKLHYLVNLDGGRKWRRHINQIRGIGESTRKEVCFPHATDASLLNVP